MDASLPEQLERAIRAAHPTGVYEEFQLGRSPQGLVAAPVDKVLADLQRVPGAVIDHEEPQHSAVRSYAIYIGRTDAPGWMELNREFSGLERIACLRRATRGIVYWTLLVSQVGPYWTDTWNEFVLREEDVLVDIPTPPTDPDWRRIVAAVSTALRSRQIRHLEPSVLARPVPWLRTSKGDMLRAQGRSPSPSVYDCFFEDLS